VTSDRQPTLSHSLGRQWGANIKARREMFGLSQTALATRCGITQQAIAKFESGQQIPLDRTKVAIAKALCVEIGELFDWPAIADLQVDNVA
jgi:transcriptional regulator with XRE-family HTH domain